MIEIHLNGEKKAIADAWTVEDLVRDLELGDQPVAIELNEEIISRKQWQERRLSSGDRVEIVHFVGGGEKTNA